MILATPFVEIHRLAILPFSQCSLHLHERKWNAFYVRKGTLYIDVRKNDYKLTDTTVLGPGDLTSVKPGEFHRFRTGEEEVEAIELYYPDSLSEDILRETCGVPQIDCRGAPIGDQLEVKQPSWGSIGEPA